MFHRVLIGFDGSRDAVAALRLADGLAGADATLIVAHVSTGGPVAADAADPAAGADAARAVLPHRPRLQHVRAAGPSVASALHTLAREAICDLLVVGGSRRRGAGRVRLGATAASALHEAPCAVAVAVPDGPRLLRRIGVAFDGTPGGRRAVQGAGAVARGLAAALTVLSVVDVRHAPPALVPRAEPDAVRQRAARLLAAVAAEQTGLGHVHRQLHRGDPVHEALGLGRASDLLVVGGRAEAPGSPIRLGSVGAPVVRRATCPVLVLPTGGPEPAGGTGTTGAAHSTDRSVRSPAPCPPRRSTNPASAG